MGEVYRARDSRLGREVAVKVSTERFEKRFKQEARLIASLNHPNICTLHDVGSNYLVMELVEGPTLADRIKHGVIPLAEGLDIAKQIADALEAAHARGIIHRDLKPANIKIKADGAVKVLDFGLAKLMTESGTDVTQTIEGTVLGTVAYMSPEQAQGKPIDERSDIFSFGAVLYEMLSGWRPFGGGSTADILSAILRDEPRPLRTSPEIERIVMCCLRKMPSERFQSMGKVRASLESSAKPAHEQPSIAVLPFANMSRDPEDEYFSDGLAEEILNALSQVEGLKVAARTSSFSFKGKNSEMSEIAAKLRVSTVLEGSVRRAGNRLRVTVQLVDVANGFQLWSERYDSQMEDIFDVQDEIARAIAERLKVTLAGGVKQATKNLEAYELYLKGRHHWHQRVPSTLRLAIQCFERAIQIDPQYALAYAGLADCYGILHMYGWMPAERSQPPARAALTQAVRLAPALWEVSFSHALYTFHFERAWREAGTHFEKAINANPRSALAQAYYGGFLATDGRVKEAVTHTGLACQLDPLSPFIHAFTAAVIFIAGLFEEAERAARHSLELQPGYLTGLWLLGLSASALGRNQEAIEALEQVSSISRAPIYVGFLGLVYARSGRLEDANRLVRELEERSSRGEYVPAFAQLSISVGQGDFPAVRQTLGKALAEATPPFIMRAITFPEPLRSDPEIRQLLAALYDW